MQILLNLIRGALIGMAELVPGISGGTVALIVGIYERALRNANDLISGRLKKVEWGFLCSVGVGMVGAALGLSSLLSSFVENQVSLAKGLFMGMVAVSIYVPLAMMTKEERRQPSSLISLLIAAVAIFFVTGFTSTPIENPPLVAIFFAAAIAVCALILPGVSGSLMLLTMGLYAPVLAAVAERDLVVMGVFITGALCGLAGFVKFLNYLLKNHRAPTLAAMAGFMLGSLRALWPFGAQQDASVPAILAVFVVGAVVVGTFIVLDARKAKETTRDADAPVATKTN